MNRGRDVSKVRAEGFTVVETLVFLAVSSVLFVSALLLISGRQSKTQFNNAIRDFESNLIDVANDVANGYYHSHDNLTCVLDPDGAPSVNDNGTNSSGQNDKCIYLGRLIKFASSGNSEVYETYSLAGLTKSSGIDVTNIIDAKPRLITQNSTIQANKPFGYGTTIECIAINSGSCLPNNNYAIAFLTNLRGGVNTIGSSPSLTSGTSIQASLYAYSNVSKSSTVEAIADEVRLTGTVPAPRVQRATLCLKSGTTNQFGRVMLKIDDSSSLAVSSEINNTPCI